MKLQKYSDKIFGRIGIMDKNNAIISIDNKIPQENKKKL